MKKLILMIAMLQLPHLILAGEYVFVGMRGEIFLLDDDNNSISNLSGPKDESDIEDCMYCISGNQMSLYIMTISGIIYKYNPFLEDSTKRVYHNITRRGTYYSGLLYDTEAEAIASSLLTFPKRNGKMVAERDKFYILSDEEKKEKTKLDNCLAIFLMGQRSYFPQGEYKKEEFASKHSKSNEKILKVRSKWIFIGQSKRWLCYSSPAYDEPGDYMNNSTWIKDKDTEWEKVYSWTDVFANPYVYPDSVLLSIRVRKRREMQSSKSTGEYYIQLPREENLRKIVMNPAAKHLWANAQSVFFQLGKDILRVDYADGQQPPVKICEIEEPLFCMFEKDNILAALADGDNIDKKEKDKDKDKKDKTTE